MDHMFTDLDCQAVIDEATPKVDPIRVQKTSCKAWKVPKRSSTAKLMKEHGLPLDDAQVVRYGEGGGYKWHTDGKARSRTNVIQLSPPNTYEGGDLEIDLGDDIRVADKTQGAVVSFSSNIPHRATEVVSGERWVLVVWEAQML
jgi:predicted 2-oxoglutarate/Fe(II)-dependent dioxygenase YbiX